MQSTSGPIQPEEFPSTEIDITSTEIKVLNSSEDYPLQERDYQLKESDYQQKKSDYQQKKIEWDRFRAGKEMSDTAKPEWWGEFKSVYDRVAKRPRHHESQSHIPLKTQMEWIQDAKGLIDAAMKGLQVVVNEGDDELILLRDAITNYINNASESSRVGDRTSDVVFGCIAAFCLDNEYELEIHDPFESQLRIVLDRVASREAKLCICVRILAFVVRAR